MALGLYFDNENISLVESKKSRKGFLVSVCRNTLMGDASLKEGIDISDMGGQVSPELKIVANLQKVLREASIATKDVVFSLPAKELTVRSFKMPKIPKKEWDESIRFEAKKYIPFMIEDVISSFFVKPSKLKSNEMEVLFLACPKKTVNKYLSLLKDANLNVVALEAEIFSILRVIQDRVKKEKANSIAVLKWHGSNGFVLILEKGTPRVVRDFSIPMINNIKPEQIPQRLANELRLSFAYYKKEFQEDKVDKIYLCVDEQNSSWAEPLQSASGVPVDLVKGFQGIAPNSAAVENFALSYIAYGASLRNLVKTAFQIDLSQEKRLFKYRYEMSKPVKMIIVAGLTLILGLFGFYQYKVSEARKTLRATIAKRPQTKVVGDPGVDTLKDLRRTRQDKLRTLKNLVDERQFLTYKLAAVASNLPNGVWIDEITFLESVANDGTSSTELVIKGFAFLQDENLERAVINSFTSNLQRQKDFARQFELIDLAQTKQIERNGYNVTSFELRCTPKLK